MENYKSWRIRSRLFIRTIRFRIRIKPIILPFICQLVKSLGSYAEVVSDMEYTLAKAWLQELPDCV